MSPLEKVFREIENLKNIIANEKCEDVKDKFRRLLQDTLEEARGLAEGIGTGIKKTFDGFRYEDIKECEMEIMNPISPIKNFTTEELERYDGKEGRPAYIAVEGSVYDISSNINEWTEGVNSTIIPGTDVTTHICRNYGNTNVMKDVPVIGKLQD